MTYDFKIHRVADPARLLRWRMEVLDNVFGPDALTDTPELYAANAEFLRKHLADGSHVALMASCDGTDIGSGDLCIYEEMPSPDNLTGICAFIMNVYVREPFRNRGVASAIVRQLIAEAESRHAGKIYLETTGSARNLYAHLGFSPMTGYMKL